MADLSPEVGNTDEVGTSCANEAIKNHEVSENHRQQCLPTLANDNSRPPEDAIAPILYKLVD